jgi:hypothetical protein
LKSFGRSIEIWCDFLNVAILVFLAIWRLWGYELEKKQQHNRTTSESKTINERKSSRGTKNNHEDVQGGIPDKRLLWGYIEVSLIAEA